MVEIGKIMVLDQTGQKVSNTPSQPISYTRWQMPFIPVTYSGDVNRIGVQALWANKNPTRPSLKKN
jgi:hypothetical protein